MTDDTHMDRLKTFAVCVAALAAGQCLAQDQMETLVNTAVRPVMQAQGIPGMAVAVTVNGTPHSVSVAPA